MERMKQEKDWDKKLNIDTIGRDDSKEDACHYPYEPTPYCVLERLADSGYISDENLVIDYGCGKGRVGFFLNHQLGCKVIGLDFDERMCQVAYENLQNYEAKSAKEAAKKTNIEVIKDKMPIEFLCEDAEKYEIKGADAFYFFNPFSVEILQSVVAKIKKSYYENLREIQLFFYYPSDEYISYLMTVTEIMFIDEIDCRDLFEGNNDRERIVIFEMM